MSNVKKYCVQCGTAHIIGLSPIKFCSNCGNPFDASITASIPKPQQPVVTKQTATAKYTHPIQEIDAPPSEDFQLPQINPSDFEVSAPVKKATIADIKNNPGAGGERGGATNPMLTPEQVKANMEALFAKEREFVSTTKNTTE